MRRPLYTKSELKGILRKARKLVKEMEGAEVCHGDDPCVESFLESAHRVGDELQNTLMNMLLLPCPDCNEKYGYSAEKSPDCATCGGDQFVTRVGAHEARSKAKEVSRGGR